MSNSSSHLGPWDSGDDFHGPGRSHLADDAIAQPATCKGGRVFFFFFPVERRLVKKVFENPGNTFIVCLVGDLLRDSTMVDHY